MLVRHLSLRNFRLYAMLETDLPGGLTIVQGDNAQGKTSLLESIYVLATAHSPHNSADRQLINKVAELPFAKLRATVARRDGNHDLEITLQKGELNRLKKDIKVDHNSIKRNSDLVGQLAVVLFLPGDVELVSGAPALRREFLDDALSQVDRDYVIALDKYEKALTQRNALLKQAFDRGLDPDTLESLNDQLVPAGVEIALRRRRAIADLARIALPVHRELSNGLEFLQLAYQPNFDPAAPTAVDDSYQISLEAATPDGMGRAELEQAFRAALHERQREEMARGVTLVGPHRDEMRFIANGLDMGEYGSRGQQRTSVLALKLAQVRWMRDQVGEEPVLLLDEVLAELDPHRRRCLLAHIGDSHQTIVTTTDINRFDQNFVKSAKLLTVQAGVVRES